MQKCFRKFLAGYFSLDNYSRSDRAVMIDNGLFKILYKNNPG